MSAATPDGPRPIVGRLAPSPTGGLHLGHARTFLLAWIAARHAGGRVVLRIEDLDASRVRAEAKISALTDLRWLSLDWDEGPDVGGPSGPYIQSERLPVYEEFLARLRRDERIYPCTCTRADSERAATAPHAEDEGPVYPGTCARRSSADAAGLAGRPFAWRFRVPPGSVAWDDLFRGPCTLDAARLGGDFIVAREGVGPSYQLAVVADDALMGVNQVIRGDDLVPSTPRQILLYEAFRFPLPRFGHVPLAVGPDGRRLAKRDNAIKLGTLRDAGADPRRLIGAIARSLGLEPAAPGDLIGRYNPATMPREPWAVTPEVIADCFP